MKRAFCDVCDVCGDLARGGQVIVDIGQKHYNVIVAPREFVDRRTRDVHEGPHDFCEWCAMNAIAAAGKLARDWLDDHPKQA